MKNKDLKKLFEAQIAIPPPNKNPINIYTYRSVASNESFYDRSRRDDDRRLFYYVRSYIKNKLEFGVRELWLSELEDSGDKFKNGWLNPYSKFPQLEPQC